MRGRVRHSYDGRTCLHLAASTGSLPICEMLIEHGANINAKDRWGGTPLCDAVREGYGKVAESLRKAGAELGYDTVTAAGELCASSSSSLASGGRTSKAASCLRGSSIWASRWDALPWGYAVS